MRTSRIPSIATLTALLIFAAIALLPLAMTINLSQKESGELIQNLWRPPRSLHPEFYTEAAAHLWSYMLNSLFVAAATVIGVLTFSALAGYALARLKFPGREFHYSVLMSLMFIPGILTLIPMYLWVKEFPLAGGNNLQGQGGSGLLNTWWALILPGWAWGQLFGIFMFRSFFASIPEELIEAARIEGASELRILWSMVVPLSRPVIVAISIMQFIGVYNDYIWPLVTISDASRQVFGVGITRFVADGNLQIGPMMAGYVIGALPLVVVFALGMKHYVGGVTQGAIR
ncbi:MAG TPA: carbohydrate ABC transporter permease [Candidatus Sumerlaeota bacterium]|nr:carbohydrate ABC transporter permease [Candidatus Sumerlaeota bacterium]